VDTTKKTIIVFSGDFDKVMAALIIANGAAAMGDDVTMFFTFWGLNALRKMQKVKTQKGTLQGMFSRMMPRGIAKLSLSKMNFAGMGVSMMNRVIKDAGAMTLPELLDSAIEQGVEYAGVAAYLAEADEANVNLFI
jgi:peroxiredoxin family protein